MTVIVGVDVGNATTEVVLVRETPAGPEILAATRAMTRGVKGSADSVRAAGRLAQGLAERCSVTVDLACLAPLHPVRTISRTGQERQQDLSPLRLVSRFAATAAGGGSALGRPCPVQNLTWPTGEPGAPCDMLAIVDRSVHYATAANLINEYSAKGGRVVGVLAERDEAVLIANRLRTPVPVIDQISLDLLENAVLLAVEARPQGQPLRQLSDPYWIADAFGLDPTAPQARGLVAQLADASYGVVAHLGQRHEAEPAARGAVPDDDESGHVRWEDGSTSGLLKSIDRLRSATPGAVTGIAFDGSLAVPTHDVYAVHLEQITRMARSRRGTIAGERLVTAVLEQRTGAGSDPTKLMEEAMGVPVHLAESETVAGRSGALTTPGCPESALVVDLGGGTIDVSDGLRHSVLAGAGEMLTAAVAEALLIPRGTADYAKRGPALRVDAPQIVVDEKGSRSFLETAMTGHSIGALCVQGPVGLTPFNRSLDSGEWRAWRTACKAAVIGQNVVRALSSLGVHQPVSLILIGGAAGDDEVLAAVTECLPEGSTVGRGNVAGSLGHRYAVAYGLARRRMGKT